MASRALLYSFWRSSCSWRVRIALNLKEIPYDIKTINIGVGEHNRKDFLEVSPTAYVPALTIDGHTIVESVAICEYLEETRPQEPLLPQDAYERAKVRELCEIISSGIQPLQNASVINKLDENTGVEWAQHWIERGLNAVENILSTTAGKYCFGDEITLADCFLIPQVYNARRFEVDLEPYPTITRIDKELQGHPAFVPAHPTNQPDFPSDGPAFK